MRGASSFFICASFIATSMGVTLSNYRRRDCSSAGGAEICYDTAPLPGCCGSTSNRYFVSGDCAGCTSTDIHFLFGPGAGGACSVARTGSNEGNCVNAQNAKGHGWCRVCGTRVAKLVADGASAEELPIRRTESRRRRARKRTALLRTLSLRMV